MKTLAYAIGAIALAASTSVASAQSEERGFYSPVHPAVKAERQAERPTFSDQVRSRMPVSLERRYDDRARTPDDAYRVQERWSGNDNEG